MKKLHELIVMVVFAVIGLMGGQMIGKAWAIRVNPTSNVMGDSANAVNTLIYRDDNGDHASRDVTVRSIITSDSTASRLHTPAMSSATLQTITPSAAGEQYAWINSLNNLVGMCVSSGTTQSAIVLSSQPASPCRQ